MDKKMAVIIGGGYTEVGDKKTPAMAIEFKCEDNKTITWFGYMTEASYPYTLDKLAELQFDESKALLKNDKGEYFFDGTFFGVKEVELVIEQVPGIKNPDKLYEQVKYINIPGSHKWAKMGVEKLPFDMKAQMAAARARVGVKKPEPSEDKVPF